MKILQFVILYLTIIGLTHQRSLPKYKVDLDNMLTYIQVLEPKVDLLRAHIEKVAKMGGDPEIERIRSIFLENNSEEILLEKYGKTASIPLFTSFYLDIPFKDIALVMTLYEFACFAAIAKDDNNEIYLLRNLDWNKDANIEELFADIDFYYNGEYVYSGIQLIGIGILMDARRPGQYSVALNKRYFTPPEVILESLKRNAYTVSMVLNLIVEHSTTYEEAVRNALSLDLTARAFVTVAGVETGCVLQLDHVSPKVEELKGRKFLSIENDDLGLKSRKRKVSGALFRALDELSPYNFMLLLQFRPLRTGITIYSLITKVSTGQTFSKMRVKGGQ